MTITPREKPYSPEKVWWLALTRPSVKTYKHLIENQHFLEDEDSAKEVVQTIYGWFFISALVFLFVVYGVDDYIFRETEFTYGIFRASILYDGFMYPLSGLLLCLLAWAQLNIINWIAAKLKGVSRKPAITYAVLGYLIPLTWVLAGISVLGWYSPSISMVLFAGSALYQYLLQFIALRAVYDLSVSDAVIATFITLVSALILNLSASFIILFLLGSPYAPGLPPIG